MKNKITNDFEKTEECYTSIIKIIQEKFGKCNLDNNYFNSIMMVLLMVTSTVITQGSHVPTQVCDTFYKLLSEMVKETDKVKY